MSIFNKKCTLAESSSSDIKIITDKSDVSKEFEKNLFEALSGLKLPCCAEHINNFKIVSSSARLSPPIFIYKGKLISFGKSLSPEEIMSTIKDNSK